VIAEDQRPYPRHPLQRRGCPHDAAEKVKGGQGLDLDYAADQALDYTCAMATRVP